MRNIPGEGGGQLEFQLYTHARTRVLENTPKRMDRHGKKDPKRVDHHEKYTLNALIHVDHFSLKRPLSRVFSL